MSGAKKSDGANVQIWVYSGGRPEETWIITPTDGGFYRVTPVNSGLSLEVQGASTADYANVQQRTHTGGSNQQWRFQTPWMSPIQSQVRTGCVTVSASAWTGQKCVLDTCTNLTQSQWTPLQRNTPVVDGPFGFSSVAISRASRYFRVRFQ